MNLKHKTVVITGGTDGLGLSIAKALLEKESEVVIIGKDKVKLEKALIDLGDGAAGYVADVRNLSELVKIKNKIDSIDILINNAGVWLEGSLNDNTENEINATIDTNLKGVIFTTKVFLPKLIKDTETHILNISSTSGLKGREDQSVYSASKFGVTGFTESLKVDLNNTNVKVTGFYPGGMNTNLFDKAGTPKSNLDWMDTKKVAEILVFMLEQDSTMIMDHVVLNKRKTKTTN